MLQNNPELKSKIDQLWNKFWSGGISNPLTAIEQITYLLFMKRLDELDQKKQADAEWTGEPYTSKFAGQWIPPEYRDKEGADNYAVEKRSLRWSEFKRMQAEEMLQHVQTKVFPFLKDMNGAESNFTHHMRNAVFIIPKPALLVEAVKTIDEIFEIMEKDSQEKGQAFQDIQGDVYEMLLSEIATAGKNGQFRTPRHIIKLMADLVRPQLGHRIADPACGSGGFLLGAYQYIVTELAKKAGAKDLQSDEDGFVRTSVAAGLTEKAQAILQASLFGYDIDATMVRLGLMNLMMHGIDEPSIDYKDTLSKSYLEEAEYDIVMANPPFTGSIDKGDINENLSLSTTKTELLFVENIYRLLKKGGTACVIVPQGVLFGSGGAFKTLRKMLVERCDLKAVITMPSGVFKPYAGVSTAILLFTKVWGPKDKVTQPATEHVWFYEMQADGYSLDDKRSKQDGYGDLQDIVVRFHGRDAEKDVDRTAKWFCVSRADIEGEGYDLSLSRYKEDVFEEVDYEAPGVILERLLKEEVGEVEDADLAKVKSGIVRELLELRGDDLMQHEPLLKAAPFSGSRVQPFDGTKRYLSTGDLQEATTSFVEVTYADKPSRADISVRPGDVLFARMKGTKKVLEIDHSLADIIVSTGFAVIRPTEHCNGKFLSIYLKSDDFERQKEKYCSGAIQPAITNAGIKNLTIPFPPLDDQKRIAHLLGKVEGLIARRKHHLQQLDDLLKSVFLEMFGDPVRNEKGWEKKPLAQLGNLDRGVSKHRPRNAPELLGGKYPLIQTGDVSNAGTYITGFTQTYSEVGFAQSKLWPTGTLCITIAANIAQTGILTFDACFPDSVVGFTAYEVEANPLYVLGLFWFFQRILEKNAPAAAQKNINLKILRELEVPAPPPDLQNQFAAIVEKVEGLKSRYQQSLTDLESLYGALSQKAFKGELDLSRVVLPAEGPEIAEEEIDIEEKQPMEPLFELPAPAELALLQTAEGRKSLLGEWLNAWLEQLGDAPFTAQAFMDAARQRLWELAEDEAPDWGVAEYDELKSWVFEALKQGRLIQGYDDANNRVQITAVKG